MLLVTIVSDFLYYYISDRVLIISGFLLLIAKYIFLGLNDTLMYLLSGVCMFAIMYAIKMCGNIIFRKESKVLYCCIHFLVNSNYYLYSLFNLLLLINSRK